MISYLQFRHFNNFPVLKGDHYWGWETGAGICIGTGMARTANSEIKLTRLNTPTAFTTRMETNRNIKLCKNLSPFIACRKLSKLSVFWSISVDSDQVLPWWSMRQNILKHTQMTNTFTSTIIIHNYILF